MPVGTSDRVPRGDCRTCCCRCCCASANAVGYTNYPDNVVRYFVEQAAQHGIDVFRVFDSLNWVENMRVAIDAVRETGTALRGRDLLHRQPQRSAPDEVRPQVLRRHGAGARTRRRAHPRHQGHGGPLPAARGTHAGQGAEAGDRPPGALPHARHERHRGSERARGDRRRRGRGGWRTRCHERTDVAAEPRLDRRGAQRSDRATAASIRTRSGRCRTTGSRSGTTTRAFESDMRAGASEVYVHGMPGGQYTNLREQARSLGIDDARWHEVARAYAQVNEMFGDIVKVTPSSKVVGDMALMMVTSGSQRRSGARPGHRSGVSRVGGRAVPRRHRPAARRLPARAAEEDAGRRDAD